MFELILVVCALLAISFTCSILESVILSITRPYIQVMVDRKQRTGFMLQKMKDHIDEPIAAILTLNTISHTAGAAISGAIALQIFGSEWMALFSGVLTLVILIFSEIIPKTIGATYWKQLSPLSAIILKIMILLLKPLIIPVNFISRIIAHSGTANEVSRAEITNFVRLGHFQGSIEQNEYRIVENLFSLKTITVKEIMTPRSVVFTLPAEEKTGKIKKENLKVHFSRVPLFNEEDENITGIVMYRDIIEEIEKDAFDTSLADMAVPPSMVHENTPVYNILNYMVAQHVHFCVVRNDKSPFCGIITLEDALETLLGREIVDEFDPAVDMRELAEDGDSTG